MGLRIALAGDTMLGRGVAERLARHPELPLWDPEITRLAAEADLFVLNLECCVSARGVRWPDPAKPFFFRAPPEAARTLADLGVNAVTLANNHALDFGQEALFDTFEALADAGIAWAGAGHDEGEARRPAVLTAGGQRVGLVAVADHPLDFAAVDGRPGTAVTTLGERLPPWLTSSIGDCDADVVLVSPHWGPNMADAPLPHVRGAARAFAAAGADVVAGHSAHVFHGVERIGGCAVLYDLGDFLDDYAVDPRLRNDLSMLWFVELEGRTALAVEGVPLRLRPGTTGLAAGADRAWIVARLRRAVRPLQVRDDGARLRVELTHAATAG